MLALGQIRRNLVRSMLTTLGIVLGVASVIAMVSLGQATTAKVTADVEKLGSNLIIVSPGSARRGTVSVSAPPLTLADARALTEQAGAIGRLAPASSRGELVVFGNKNKSTVVQGSTNEWFEVRGFPVARGRTFSQAELLGGAACVIGATIQKELFGALDPIGSEIRVGAMSCPVIGVLISKGQSTFGDDQDDLVVMPLRTFQRRISGDSYIGVFFTSVAEGRSTHAAVAQIERILRQRRHIQKDQEDDFRVRDMQEIAKTLGSITGVLTALLGAVGAVSLLVGGIGIMNIMLVSVTERTREIGLRLAIGARGREVLLQFLIEAVMLSSFGGLLGIILGLGGSIIAMKQLDLPIVVEAWVVAIAVGFSAMIGIVFGFFPARRAAKLEPIEALRHE
jgi:putative ABC transport system permease protein